MYDVMCSTTCCWHAVMCKLALCGHPHMVALHRRTSDSLRLIMCRWIIDSRDELTPERLKNLDDAFKLYRCCFKLTPPAGCMLATSSLAGQCTYEHACLPRTPACCAFCVLL